MTKAHSRSLRVDEFLLVHGDRLSRRVSRNSSRSSGDTPERRAWFS